MVDSPPASRITREQCAICFEALPTKSATAADVHSATPSITSGSVPPVTTPSPSRKRKRGSNTSNILSLSEQAQVATLPKCDHIFHNDCIKQWTETANTCPECRKDFNSVSLANYVGGPVLKSYKVETKNQRPDPNYFINVGLEDLQWPHSDDDSPREEQTVDRDLPACMICGHDGDENLLVSCDWCHNRVHLPCGGLDEWPTEGFACHNCQFGVPAATTSSGSSNRTRTSYARTTPSSGRSRRSQLSSPNQPQSSPFARNQEDPDQDVHFLEHRRQVLQRLLAAPRPEVTQDQRSWDIFDSIRNRPQIKSAEPRRKRARSSSPHDAAATRPALGDGTPPARRNKRPRRFGAGSLVERAASVSPGSGGGGVLGTQPTSYLKSIFDEIEEQGV